MNRLITGFVAFSFLVLAGTARADVAADIAGGMPIHAVLTKAVAGGSTIWDAVADALAAAPDQAADIIAAAFAILRTLPLGACEIPPGTGRAAREDLYDACGRKITQAAQNAGVDQDVIDDAQAAGEAVQEGSGRAADPAGGYRGGCGVSRC